MENMLIGSLCTLVIIFLIGSVLGMVKIFKLHKFTLDLEKRLDDCYQYTDSVKEEIIRIFDDMNRNMSNNLDENRRYIDYDFKSEILSNIDSRIDKLLNKLNK